MYKFNKNKISEHIYRIDGVANVCMYFVLGKQSGLLIDTGYGLGDLRGFVEASFSIPYDVIITHGHVDHANGMGQWKQVYMNHLDLEIYREHSSLNFRQNFLLRNSIKVENISDFVQNETTLIKDIRNEEKFDLGGVHVKVIHTPGHTQGIVSLLIEEDRILMLGDSCGEFTFMFNQESSSIETYKNTLKQIESYSPYFDHIIRQHGNYISDLDIVNNNLEICEEILDGKDDHIEWQFMGKQVWIAKEMDRNTHTRKDGKSGNIVYSLDKLTGEKNENK